jgi:Ca2+-binding RTX toxin-like protein
MQGLGMAHPSRSLRRFLATAVLGAALLVFPAWSTASAATCAGRHATIVGTAGDDAIVGKKASDVIYGGGGNDRISGGSNGNDRICGGPDGAECDRGMADASCEEDETELDGPAVVRTASIDGSATLTVRGGPTSDDISVSSDSSGYTVSSAVPFPDGNAEGCDSAGGGQIHCPDGVQSIPIATEGGDDTVHVDPSVPVTPSAVAPAMTPPPSSASYSHYLCLWA